MPMTVAEVAEVVGASISGTGALDALVRGLVVDSRAVQPGSLFVALPGARVDGHGYVRTALDLGAVAVLSARGVIGEDRLCLVVPDPAAAMGKLARHLVDQAVADGLKVVAITGSQGKTSTKDLIAHVLEQVGATVSPYGNLNNELGVPLTASRIDAGTRFLVVEMGARGVGQVAYLCELTPPQVGVVLNVGFAHVGEFGSQQAIAQAKGELVESLPRSGTAVLNADDPLVWAMRQRTEAATLAFSAVAEPAYPQSVWASDITSDSLGRCRFRLHARTAETSTDAEVALALSGRHHVSNAVAAAAATLGVGVELEVIAAALSNARLRSRSRMEIHEREDDVVVINDAYNANPDSARAAVDTLAEVGRARRAERGEATTWAVLGDMLELGESAASEHATLGRHLATAGIDRLVAVGEFAVDLVEAAVDGGLPPAHAQVFTDKAEIADRLQPQLRPGDVILVKASRGLALDTVAEEIWTAPGRKQPPESEDPA
jgi:UDP-N-acetylmuramoyl-tripeptide--D-alanyl-D-alanine ligase